MATMREAVIVEAVRTPVGRRNGCLKDWHPVDLLALSGVALISLGNAFAGAGLPRRPVASAVRPPGVTPAF